MTESTPIGSGKDRRLPARPVGDATGDAPRRVRPSGHVPFGSQEQKLAWKPEPGFHLHWFNEEPGRIDRAKRAGYEHVMEDGQPVKRIVGVGRDNQGLNAYLMKIPVEWYDEDMDLEQSRVNDTEGAIKRGDVAGKGLSRQDKDEHFYVGKQGISLSRGPSIQR